MANKIKEPEVPTKTLAAIIDDLNLYKNLYFELRQGAENLISCVEEGNIEHARGCVKIFKIKEVLEKLKSVP